MYKMSEEDFLKLSFKLSPDKCKHAEVVKLYYLGMHSDYACTSCGMMSTDKDHFKYNNHLKRNNP